MKGHDHKKGAILTGTQQEVGRGKREGEGKKCSKCTVCTYEKVIMKPI
jgi:hypothetical protein